jgi:hypothetical protein
MPARRDPFEIVGTRIGDKYEVEELVEQTEFSVVYRAVHTVWKRAVAIKAFKVDPTAAAEARSELLDGFVREGALLAELSERTTAICQARDAGSLTTSGGQWVPYMVLEWIDGEALDLVLEHERERNVQPRTAQAAIALLSPIAEALALAHARGVAHCDVKPGNVLVLRDARHTKSHAKLLDFGVAQVLRGSRRDGIAASFTPGYGAPEQWSDEYGTTGPRTDVFALALIVVELLIGRDALPGDDVSELSARACDPVHRPTPRALGVDVGERVEHVLSRALALSPADRFATAREMWDALVLAAEADAAPSAGPPEGREDAGRTSYQPVTIGAVPIDRRLPIAAFACAVVACAALSWQLLFPRSLGRAASPFDVTRDPPASFDTVSLFGWASPAALSWYVAVLATLCLAASALWLGTLFSVSWFCARATTTPDGPTIGRLASSLFRRWTLPSLVVSLVAGVLWCAAAAHGDRQARWLYGVPVAVLAFVALSAAVGRRVKRIVGGKSASTRNERARFAISGDCRIQRV